MSRHGQRLSDIARSVNIGPVPISASTPHLLESTSLSVNTLIAVASGMDQRWYDSSDSGVTYAPRDFVKDQLYYNGIAPASPSAAVQSGGSLSQPATYYYQITAITASGETIGSTEVSAMTSSGNQKVHLPG